MDKSAPSLATIAKAAGVSRMTVSRALRNAPDVEKSKRERILKIAEDLGYKPDPKLAAFMHYVRQRRTSDFSERIAYILCHRGKKPPQLTMTQYRFHEGVKKRANQLGYGLEEFTLSECVISADRLAQILHTRGIRGAVVGSCHNLDKTIEPLLARTMCCVTGTAHPEFRAHRTGANHYHTIQTALASLDALGYERIGLYLDQGTDINHRHCWRAGLADFLYERKIDLAAMLHIVPSWDRKEFARWVRKAKPHAILSLHTPAWDWLREDGLSERVGFAHLDLHPSLPEHAGIAGIDQHGEEAGAIAVNMIAAGMMNFEVGPAEHPHVITVNGSWVDGASAPPRQQAD